jgi:hypothetical protein
VFSAVFLVPEGDESVPVLKSDSARGLEARRGETQELVKENAAVRVASAFRHEFELRSIRAIPCAVLSYHRKSRRPSALAAELGGMLDDSSGFKAKFLGAR